jgi:DNA-binding MarR family transcriptional regulator
LDKPTTGGVIDRLEAKDLLKRSADKSDKRLKRLTITPAGNRLLAAAQAGVARTQTRLLAPLSKAEQRLFVELLGRIVEGNNALSRAPQKPLPLPALEAAE